jgi:hypothetical protein
VTENGTALAEVRRGDCKNCGHAHIWGRIREKDGVPLYGWQTCATLVTPDGKVFDHEKLPCGCTKWIDANLPSVLLDGTELRELWDATNYLSAQTPAETRLAIRKIASLPSFAEQWPQFMGAIFSQVADTRAALTRDDNKFAQLVARTDDFLTIAADSALLKERVVELTQEIDRLNVKQQVEDALEPVTELLDIVSRRLNDMNKRVQEIEIVKSPWWRRLFGK